MFGTQVTLGSGFLATSRTIGEAKKEKQKKHLRGVSDKEQRMYSHIKKSAQERGYYPGRVKEVAARTVMAHHAKKGHKKGQ